MHTKSVGPAVRLATAGGRRRFVALVAGALAGLAVALGAGAAPASAAGLKGSFHGNAYGTAANAKAGPVAATLGRNAFLPCPCRGTNGKVLSNTIENLAAGDGGKVLKADELRSTVFTERTATTARVRDTSTVSGLNMFGGLITATAVKAVATVSANTSTIAGSPDGSTFLDLRIGGKAIGADVKPNTTIGLPGIGSVVLKKVRRGGGGTSKGSILVEMLTVNVTRANSFGLPVGARIVVAHARSEFDRAVAATVVAGLAYATEANAAIGNDLQNRIGRAALVTMGCEGTGGETLTNNISSLSVGTVLALGSGTTTAFGGPSGGGTLAKTTAEVQSASLLDGLVTAAVIKAVAQETFKGGKRTRSPGFSFVGLKVAGVPVPLDVAPNTKLTLPGIGHVIVDEQKVPTTDGRTQVNGLHVVVTKSNTLGLPAGSEIIIAHAEAAAFGS
jgi:hypothetical protein